MNNNFIGRSILENKPTPKSTLVSTICRPTVGNLTGREALEQSQWPQAKATVMHLVGQEQFQKAIPFLKKFKKSKNNDKEYNYLFGLCLAKTNRNIVALEFFQRALDIHTAEHAKNPDADKFLSTLLYQRVLCLTQEGKVSQAIAECENLLLIDPKSPHGHNLIGTLYVKSEKNTKAAKHFIRALATSPNNADYLSNLGGALRNNRKMEAAFAALKMAINQDPKHLDARLNFAVALADVGKSADSLSLFSDLREEHPKDARVTFHMAEVQRQLGLFEESINSYEKTIKLDPNHSFNLSNLALCLEKIGKVNDAVDYFERAIKRDPENPTTRFNYGLILLRQGHFPLGFKYFSSRFDSANTQVKLPNFTQKRWLGDFDVSTKTMLLVTEQGLGDTIQFCRFINSLEKKVGRLIVQVQESLVDLIRPSIIPSNQGAKIISDKETPPSFDCYCMMMDLPLALKIELPILPKLNAYLFAKDDLIKKWASILSDVKKPKVGLVCSGSVNHKDDNYRSIELKNMAEALPLGPDYVLVQKEVRETDRLFLKNRKDIREFSDKLTNFSETAALISNLDLVVSVDTSVAHLSGSLGTKTVVMLPHVADWRWFNNRSDSPWYKSVHLCRQRSCGEWDAVFSDVKAQIQFLISGK